MSFKSSIQKRLRESIYAAFPFNGLEKDEKYISVYTTKGQISNGRVFEFNHFNSDNHQLLPIKTSNILGLIHEFKTPYDHAATIENHKLANFHKALLTLQELWKSGLLISQSEFFKKLAQDNSGKESVNIDTLAWITKDRTDSIKESLESFVKCLNKTKQKCNYLVFDDSTLQNYKINKENIDLLNKRYDIQIRLVGEIQREEFLRRLCKKLEKKVPENVIEYGLMGLKGISHRTGANRNAFQLFTTGKYALLTDDDIFCQILKNGDDKKLTITSDASSYDTSTEFFAGKKELNDKITFDHTEPLTIHQKLLGLSVGGLIGKNSHQILLNRGNPKFILDNLSLPKKVRVTMMGAAGDSGAGSPILKIFFPGHKLVPLISDTNNFSARMYSRIVLQSHKSFTVGPPNFLLGMNLGIDNTELLPPFHPNFRNSDGIFASVLRKCFTNSYIGHLPYAISHVPPEERPVDDSDLTSTSNRIPDILRFSIDEYNNPSHTAVEGLKSLGIFLRDISKRSDASITEYLGLINTDLTINKINGIEYLYKEYKHINKQWTGIAEQRMEILYKCLQNGVSSFKFKEIESLSSEDQLHTIRKVYRNFGDLLYNWPEIYACVETSKQCLFEE